MPKSSLSKNLSRMSKKLSKSMKKNSYETVLICVLLVALVLWALDSFFAWLASLAIG